MYRTDKPTRRILFCLQVIVSEHRQQPLTHLIVWDVKKIRLCVTIKALDSQITTLINHRQWHFYIRLIIIKLTCEIILSYQLIHVLVKMRKQTNQISRCATLKPIVSEVHLVKGIQDAKGIKNICHAFTEMIAIIFLFKHSQHLVITTIVIFCKFLNWFSKISDQLILGNSTYRLVVTIQTDVIRLVEPAEHANLRELCNTCEENKAKVSISPLESSIKRLHDVAMLFLQTNHLT